MGLVLDRLQQRIVGVMIEKQRTVPDTYPLTVNALVAGCNQKNNRDPEMSVEPYEVEGALRALMEQGWVVQMEKDGGRTPRYEHRAAEQLAVGPGELAILSELLCRGPQAPGALKTRASRMHPFPSPEDVEKALRGMAERPVPYVEVLARQPREHQPRWSHLLGPSDVPAEEAREPGLFAAAPAPRAAVPPPPAPPTPDASMLEERLADLEREVEALRSRLDRLEGR
jgi:uncharacterized protein YceH (UPF0502 family)